MIIIREQFTAKPGQASALAKVMKSQMDGASDVTVMTDLTGKYNTVVVEMRVEDLATWEKQMKEYMKKSPSGNQKPAHVDLYQTGRRDIFRIVE